MSHSLEPAKCYLMLSRKGTAWVTCSFSTEVVRNKGFLARMMEAPQIWPPPSMRPEPNWLRQLVRTGDKQSQTERWWCDQFTNKDTFKIACEGIPSFLAWRQSVLGTSILVLEGKIRLPMLLTRLTFPWVKQKVVIIRKQINNHYFLPTRFYFCLSSCRARLFFSFFPVLLPVYADNEKHQWQCTCYTL